VYTETGGIQYASNNPPVSILHIASQSCGLHPCAATPRAPDPALIVIATLDEVVPPDGLQFAPVVQAELERIDFGKALVILYPVGQIPGNATLDGITRQGNQVQIRLKSFSAGPGNYVVEGYSTPYQLIVMDKSGAWNREIEFEIVAPDGTVLAHGKHFVP
jgi:hypothetical protein